LSFTCRYDAGFETLKHIGENMPFPTDAAIVSLLETLTAKPDPDLLLSSLVSNQSTYM